MLEHKNIQSIVSSHKNNSTTVAKWSTEISDGPKKIANISRASFHKKHPGAALPGMCFAVIAGS
jgi:hypothetical protein